MDTDAASDRPPPDTAATLLARWRAALNDVWYALAGLDEAIDTTAPGSDARRAATAHLDRTQRDLAIRWAFYRVAIA